MNYYLFPFSTSQTTNFTGYQARLTSNVEWPNKLSQCTNNNWERIEGNHLPVCRALYFDNNSLLHVATTQSYHLALNLLMILIGRCSLQHQHLGFVRSIEHKRYSDF